MDRKIEKSYFNTKDDLVSQLFDERDALLLSETKYPKEVQNMLSNLDNNSSSGDVMTDQESCVDDHYGVQCHVPVVDQSLTVTSVEEPRLKLEEMTR